MPDQPTVSHTKPLFKAPTRAYTAFLGVGLGIGSY